MSFLAPAFLLGALALALPVVFHLIRRSTRERTPFSSLLFLQPSPPRLTKRSRLEHLLLLLLRCLALALLVFGFSRPFLKNASLPDPTSRPARQLVVLVDRSASMQRDGLWSAARDRAAAILREATPEDRVSLLAFDRSAQTLMSFDEWNSTAAGDRVGLALSRLDSLKPSWAATQLGNALIAAAEALGETDAQAAAPRRQVVLLSDLQEGGRLEQLQAFEWPKGVELQIEPIKARHVGNAGLQLVTESAEAADTATNATVRVRVSNSADAKKEQFQVGWLAADGKSLIGTPLDVYVPPGQSRIVSLAVPLTSPAPTALRLRGDDEEFDNTVHVIPPAPAQVNLLYLGTDTETDVRQPLFFLRRALPDTKRQSVRLLARKPSDPLAPAEMEATQLAFVTDAPDTSQLAALRSLLAAGKTVVLAPKTTAAAASLAALAGIDSVPVTEAAIKSYAMLGEIDFRHPLFAPFADPRFGDFTKVHIWKHRRFDLTKLPGARAVARFDSGDPAVLELSVGRGRVLVLATGWHPEDSQLALSTKFVPLVFSMLELGGAISVGATPQLAVGDPLPLPTLAGATDVKLRRPDGKLEALSASATNLVTTDLPGIYALEPSQPSGRFAVNLDPNESRTLPVAPDEFERFGVKLAGETLSPDQTPQRKERLQATEAENRQKLWRWFLVGTLVVLLLESAIAGWTARRTVVPSEVPA
jgi:hypothetical protein